MMKINSEISLGGMLDHFTTDEVKAEPMMFNCRGDWAYENGGPITKQFLDRLLLDANTWGREGGLIELDDIVFDSRVHMLKIGWFPCIPGFHHDDVPRYRQDGQPWYAENEAELVEQELAEHGEHLNGRIINLKEVYRSKHALALIGDDICRTEFALGEAEFNPVERGEILYKLWHPEVVKHILRGNLDSFNAPMHQVVFFDDRSWHQGTPAKGSGWRWFGRASWDTDRIERCTNEIRTQVQVYLENPMEGW